MLENMALISSITNEWSQQQHHHNTNNNNNNNNNNNHNQLLDEKILMAAASNGRVVASEKQQQIIQQEQQQQQQQQQQQALKCPRCDSSNTKFCYYNNYSLSQPRHFCKACKRYWTRGGTLRNVPVGGGCRKNKRVKRPTSSSSSAAAIDTPSSSSSAPTSNPNPSSIQPHHMDHHMSSVFYGLQTNPSDHLSYSRFNPRVSNVDTVVSGFDLQPQLSALGLGFSSEFNGFNNPNTLLSSYPMFGSSAASSNSPTMASLLPSSSFQQQQKYFSNGLKDLRGGGTSFHGLGQYQDLQMQGNSAGKEVKMEEAHGGGGGGGGGGGRIDWDLHEQNQTHHDQINSSDPNLYWNGSGFGGAWLDPANIGSSVPSLI